MDSLIKRFLDDARKAVVEEGKAKIITIQEVQGFLHYCSRDDSVYLINLDDNRIYRLPEGTEMTYLEVGCDDVSVRLEHEVSDEDGKSKWHLKGTCMSNSGMNGIIVTASISINDTSIFNRRFYTSYCNLNAIRFSETYPYSQYQEFSSLDSVLSELGAKSCNILTVYIMHVLKDACIDEEILKRVSDICYQQGVFWPRFYNYHDRYQRIFAWVADLELYLYEQKQKTQSVTDAADGTELKGIRYYMDKE